MIKKKTLLVLGAGASMPYGFPSGDGLANYVRGLANREISEEAGKLYKECGSSTAEIQSFARAFLNSGLPSVDAFLSHQKQMDQACKLAICLHLADAESDRGSQWETNNDHWYRHLWERMRRDTNSPQDILNNRLRIATFNYDRSLEFFLYRAIRATYGCSEDDAQQLLAKLWIRHIYGDTGQFHYLDKDGGGRYYRQIRAAAELAEAAARIRLIPETRTDDKLFQEMRTWFDWAEEVAFMGFSFYQENCERLDFGAVVDWKNERKLALPHVVACTYMMTPAEVAVAHQRISKGLDFVSIGQPNLAFLRSTDLLN